MKNNKIRLTESQLHQVIGECVKKYLNEIADNKESQDNILNAVQKSAISNIKTRLKGKKLTPKQEHNRQRNLNIEKNIKSKKLKESISLGQEDRLRSMVGQMADQIHSMIDKLTMHDSGMNNYLADLCQNERWMESLYDAYYGMKEFAKSSAERKQEDEDAMAMPDGGYEKLGY